jgi:hypothetical protein
MQQGAGARADTVSTRLNHMRRPVRIGHAPVEGFAPQPAIRQYWRNMTVEPGTVPAGAA